MNTSFTKKLLEAHITLAEGGFNTATGQGANTKIIRLGMDVDIQKPGGKEKNKAKVKIFNMPLADMETLTTLAFKPLQASKNRIAVYAGDEEHGMSLAFSGDIVSAVPNFNAAPDPSFDVECITGYVASITPVPPLTAQGAQDVATLMQGLAKQMGLAFVNRGVSVSIRNIAIIGGPMEQAQQLAHDARIDLIVDDGEKPSGLPHQGNLLFGFNRHCHGIIPPDGLQSPEKLLPWVWCRPHPRPVLFPYNNHTAAGSVHVKRRGASLRSPAGRPSG